MGRTERNEPATRTWRREKPAAREEGSEMDSKGKAEKGGVRIVHMRCFPLHTPVFIGISIRSFQGIEWELQLRSMKQKENTTRVLNWPEWARIREWAKPAATSTPFTSSFSLRCNAFPSSSLPLPSPLSSATRTGPWRDRWDLQPLCRTAPLQRVRQCVPLLPPLSCFLSLLFSLFNSLPFATTSPLFSPLLRSQRHKHFPRRLDFIQQRVRKVQGMTGRVVEVAAGHAHALAVDEHGCVYAWGWSHGAWREEREERDTLTDSLQRGSAAEWLQIPTDPSTGPCGLRWRVARGAGAKKRGMHCSAERRSS